MNEKKKTQLKVHEVKESGTYRWLRQGLASENPLRIEARIDLFLPALRQQDWCGHRCCRIASAKCPPQCCSAMDAFSYEEKNPPEDRQKRELYSAAGFQGLHPREDHTQRRILSGHWARPYRASLSRSSWLIPRGISAPTPPPPPKQHPVRGDTWKPNG